MFRSPFSIGFNTRDFHLGSPGTRCEIRIGGFCLHPDRSPQVQDATPSQEAKSSPQSQSKKEHERIFGVVPTNTITDARNAPPLKSKDKFHLFVNGTLDPFPFVVYAVQAGVEQANDSHSGYGQGAAGYARRFGVALCDGTSARFFSTYAFPSLLHQDPRFFRKGEGSGWSRVGYSLSRGFVTRSDSGKTQPNWSDVLGKFTGAEASDCGSAPYREGRLERTEAEIVQVARDEFAFTFFDICSCTGARVLYNNSKM